MPPLALVRLAGAWQTADSERLRAAGVRYDLRWFTPLCEVDLCGHATLASAFVVMRYIDPSADSVTFTSKSGSLVVARQGERFSMRFPRRDAVPCEPPEGLLAGLGR